MTKVSRQMKRLPLIAATFPLVGLVGTAGAQVVGFGGSTNTGWTPNASTGGTTAGVPNVVGTGTSADVLTLTTTANGEASSYWYNTPQSIGNFTESFTYRDVGTNGADGITAVWQNAGLTALGGGGGQLGYGGIASAAGLAINIYSGAGGSETQYNPTLPAAANPALTPTPGGVNLAAGNPLNFTLSYREADGALTERVTDTVTAATYTRIYRGISIGGQVGATSAFIGFTGATGGINANQTVTNFQFTPGAAAPTPVSAIRPIAATGWNQNMIVSATTGSNVTAAFDGGTANPGNEVFFEQGQDAASPGAGVPRAGVVFGSATDANHSFVLQPNGPGQNDAVLLDVADPTGTLTLGGATAFSTLSFLVAGANGGGAFTAVINYANGTSQTATITAPDWFSNTPIAFDANGRVIVTGSGTTATYSYNSLTAGNPRMYQEDLTLTDTVDAVTSINMTTNTTGTVSNREIVFGLSGAPSVAVPEPASVGLLVAGGIGLAARRRRAGR